MIVRTLVVVAVLIAGVLIFAATKPKTFRIERTTMIDAPPERIFALLNDFHNWPMWETLDRRDATIKRTFSGSASGAGAISEWAGSGSTGKGRMSITKSVAPTIVAVMADWEKPFVAHNLNEFTLEPHGRTTKLTWTMQGTNVYVMKLMSVFVNMDRFMGKHFEAGLASLKSAAETGGH
jgi:uncharacterized protein YndB with AHSA1/START domain